LRLLQGQVAMLPMRAVSDRRAFLPSLRDSVPFSLASDAALKGRSSTNRSRQYVWHEHAADNPAGERPVEGRVGGSEEEAAIMPGAQSLRSFQAGGDAVDGFCFDSRGVSAVPAGLGSFFSRL
jgi:hypothetical protein